MELSTDRQAMTDKAISDAADAGCCCGDDLHVVHVHDSAGVWHVVLSHESECDHLRHRGRRP